MSEKDQEASVPPDKQEHLSTILRGLQEQQITPSGTIEAEEIRATNVVSGIQYIERQINLQVTGNQAAPSSSRKQGPLFMAADMPADFVARPHEFEALKQGILQGQHEQPIGTTVALHGAGGFGKTMLAQALCHDPDIQAAFRDGILWVTLGEQPRNLVGKIEDLIYLLSQERVDFTSLEAATTKLRDTLADRVCLLVIDDVWRASDLTPFVQGGPRCARLLTTRNDQVLPATASSIQVDAMRQEEAIRLLRTGLEVEHGGGEHTFQYLANRLGEWPLLLTLANGVLRERVGRLHEPLPAALGYLQRAFDKRGVLAFDARNAQERKEAVARTLEVSFAQLDAEEHARYEELAIFPQDTPIPLETVHRLWQATGMVDEIDTEDLCRRLYGLSLLSSLDLATRRMQLHDVVRNYLQVKLGTQLAHIHGQFLNAYGLVRWANLSPEEPYLWEYLALHLLEAGRGEILVTTVKDLRYLATKVLVRGTSAVEADLASATEQAPNDAELMLLRRQIVGMAHLLGRGKILHEVECILLSRLGHRQELATVCSMLEQEMARPLLKAWYPLPDLISPTLIRTLIGHSSVVTRCAISPAGDWIVSASNDKTLKIWDTQTWHVRHTLHGHTGEVTSCAISPKGDWIVSCSSDKTLKVWNAYTGEERQTFQGHTSEVTRCAISPAGDWVVSASNDKTLKIWDTQTGDLLHTLQGHTGGVTSCAVNPKGGWIVSASNDKTLKIWDTQTGDLLHTLQGHTMEVTDCAVSPAGDWIVSTSEEMIKLWDIQTGVERRHITGEIGWITSCAISQRGQWIVSASGNGLLKVWDAQTGVERTSLQGHIERVTDCGISPAEDWIVSSSNDQTLKIWDARAEPEHYAPRGYIGWINGCAVSPRGDWIVSASNDQTLKVWDTASGTERLLLRGHTQAVNGCAVSPRGDWIVSASNDQTLKVWDVASGAERTTLWGHANWVTGCAVSPRGDWIVSASNDQTLKVWDTQKGLERMTLHGHTREVSACVISPAGDRIVSASWDETLKVWDAVTGVELFTLQGHTDWVNSCAISPEGDWIVSASADQTLKVWDVASGMERFTLPGHSDWVNGCAISPGGERIISVAADQTLKVWGAQSGNCLATLHVDGILFSCAFHPNGEYLIAAGEGGLYFLHLIM